MPVVKYRTEGEIMTTSSTNDVVNAVLLGWNWLTANTPVWLVIVVLVLVALALGWWLIGPRTMRVITLIAVLAGAAWIFYKKAEDANPFEKGDILANGRVYVVLAALALLYLSLEWIGTRREPPRVVVDEPSTKGDNAITKDLLNELRLQLPAVKVHHPSPVPGGQARPEVAAKVIEGSEIPGGQLLSAFLELVARLTPTADTYLVRLHAEPATGDNAAPPDTQVSVTVDLRKRGSGKSMDVITLPPTPMNEAAERTAGFVASRVFQVDPTVARPMEGRFDGEDLTAYLLSRQPRYEHPTYEAVRRDRQRIIERLETAVADGPVAGIARDELASLYELEGRDLEAVRLHVLNRYHLDDQDLLRSRYRLGTVLRMLAKDEEEFKRTWTRPESNRIQQVREDILRYMRAAKLSPSSLTTDAPKDQLSAGSNSHQVRKEFLQVAKAELEGVQIELAASTRLRRRLKYWLRREHPKPACNGVKRNHRTDHRRKVHLALATVAVAQGEQPPPLEDEEPLSWPERYNQACLYALREMKTQQDETGRQAAAARVVAKLREAIDHPKCPFYRPSERLTVDPDFTHLRGLKPFDDFITDQLMRDFAWPEQKPNLDGLSYWLQDRIHEARKSLTQPHATLNPPLG
jgi:hypothetical protein